MTDRISDALIELLQPLLDEHRAAVRADVRKLLVESLAEQNGYAETAVFDGKTAAKYLGVSPRTIQRWRSEGRLPAVRIGRSVRYRREDLDALLNKTT